MTEVEKLYSLANIDWYDRYYSCKDNKEGDCNDNCELCDDSIEVKCYPPFTAEKQLKLIEFMLKKYGEETIGFELWKDNSYHAMCYLGYDGFENYADSDTLGGAIAGLITLYWQDLTEAEQNEIKNILKG